MKMMIDGQKTESGDGKTIPVINPITNEMIDTIPMATKKDVDRALEASKRGLKKWSAVPLKEKEVFPVNGGEQKGDYRNPDARKRKQRAKRPVSVAGDTRSVPGIPGDCKAL